MRKLTLLISIICSAGLSLYSQNLENFGLSTTEGLLIKTLVTEGDSTGIQLESPIPVFSFELNGRYHVSNDVNSGLAGTRFIMNYENSLSVTFTSFGGGHPGWRGEITFENEGFDTIEIANVLPFGENPDNIYITGKGPWDLARAWLHRSGYMPVRVILPDNAWELGYSSFELPDKRSVCALIRRSKNNGATYHRYKTILPPRSSVSYNFYGETFKGDWQEGLRLMFRDRYLHDLYDFNTSLYDREDLKWIRNSYLIALQFAWDKTFYDRFANKYTYGESLKEYNRLFGHLDVFGIWPTWPRLGVDMRNQWDLYDDLPGGTVQLRNFANMSRQYNTRFFIAYNPWDNSTRIENHYTGMARLINDIEADGVVLDTRGSSSYELQSAADSVRGGVVMYSEGMAVVKDMPGIVSGRVHNAIFYSPELNLNKLIKPDFAIFRVCDVGEAPLHREIAISFFNGYGTELNLFRPGRSWQLEKDYELLGKTTMILRENTDAFLDLNWIPLVDTGKDKIFANRWKSGSKVIYTILNMNPEGVEEALIKADPDHDYHYVSLWHHEEITPDKTDNLTMLMVDTEPYKKSYSGGRLESSLDCIAGFRELLKLVKKGDSLYVSGIDGLSFRIWQGEPSYQGLMREFSSSDTLKLKISELFPLYEGKLVCQLLDEGILLDERVIQHRGGEAWLISKDERTAPQTGRIPRNMVLIPGADFKCTLTANDNFIPHPERQNTLFSVDSFLIDVYPVSNEEYYNFTMETGYFPMDTVNYLKHWQDGIYVAGQEKYPVVNISLDDARAYAAWAGKRLPAEEEWQLAAQGTDGRLWPWGNEFHGTKCNNSFGRPTPVDAFKKGASPYGVIDMVGNIWQMTNDVYDNGTHYFLIIRGGSHYQPESSWWYIQGGPQQLDKTQMLQLVSPGFDRSSTIGFRCVKDI